MKDASISLILPAYNEEENIEKIGKNYIEYLQKNFEEFELIIVCNNCSDETPKIAEAMAENNANIRVLDFPYYTGKGGAVLEGFKVARNGLIGFVDADESTAPQEFHKLVKAIENCDVAIASRAGDDSVIAKEQPLYRRTLGLVFRHITNLLFGLQIKDTQCGAKLFRRNVIEKVLPSMKRTGWEFDVELLWKAKLNGFLIREIGIVWLDSKESKVSLLSPFSMIVGLLKLKMGM